MELKFIQSLYKHNNTALAVKILFLKTMLKEVPREDLAIPLPASRASYTLSLLADADLNQFSDHSHHQQSLCQ